MDINVDELRIKVDLLEQLLSKKELTRISVSKRFKRLRKRLGKYVSKNI